MYLYSLFKTKYLFIKHLGIKNILSINYILKYIEYNITSV